ARLGVSKSSFYWLFENRRALLEAALQRWEQLQTDAVLPWLAAIADPAQRLALLGRNAFAATESADPAPLLLTPSADPLVPPGAPHRPLLLLPPSAAPTAGPVAGGAPGRRRPVIENPFPDLAPPPRRARPYANVMSPPSLGTAAMRRAGAAPADSDGYIAALL